MDGEFHGHAALFGKKPIFFSFWITDTKGKWTPLPLPAHHPRCIDGPICLMYQQSFFMVLRFGWSVLKSTLYKMWDARKDGFTINPLMFLKDLNLSLVEIFPCCNGFVFLLMFGSSACSNVAPRSPTIQLMLRCPLKPSTECCFDRSIGHRGGFAFRARHHWVLLEPSLANAVLYKAKYNNQGLPSVGFGSFYPSWFCCTLHRKK